MQSPRRPNFSESIFLSCLQSSNGKLLWPTFVIRLRSRRELLIAGLLVTIAVIFGLIVLYSIYVDKPMLWQYFGARSTPLRVSVTRTLL